MPSFREKPHATNLALYPTMFASTPWRNYELPFTYWYCILDIIILWTGLPFLLSYFFMDGRFCINDVTTLVILFFILKCHHLLFGTSLHSSLLVGDYVCGLSYKSNAIVWLEHFIRNIHTGKLLCINIWSCNYFSQYNIHPYFTETF